MKGPAVTPKQKKIPRWIKVVLWTAGLALTYTLAGFFLVPAIIKSQMLKRLPALTHRRAAVREVAFNPFTFSFAVRGLSLTETNGAPFAGWDEFHLQFQALASLSRRAWVFHDVTLTHPFARVIRRKDGSFNFDNLLDANVAAPATQPAPPSALPPVLIESLRLQGASLEADDWTTPATFHDIVAPVNLQLTDFATQSNAATAFVCSAATEAGEKFESSGHFTFLPLQSSGSVKVTVVDLKRYGPYLAAFTKAELIDGKVNVAGDYQFALGPQGPDASVTNGTVQLANLRLKSLNAGETVVSIPTLSVDLDEASLAKKAVHVRSIKSSGGSLLVRQSHDGTINLLALLPPPAPAAPPLPPPAAASWSAQVDEIAFDGYSVAVEDLKPLHPVKLDVSALALTIKGFNSAGHGPLATAMSMRLNGQGSLSIKGTLALVPLSGDLTLELAGLDLPPFAPYLPSQIRIALSKGQLSVHGLAHGALTPDGPAGTFAGDVSLNHVATADILHDRDLAKFDTLTVKGINAGYPPVKLQIQEIALAGFQANVVIDAKGQLNLLTIISNGPPNPAAAPASSTSPAVPIDLGALIIDHASFHFVDESIEPRAAFDVQELSGTIQGLSTHPQGPARVDFRGYVDSFSPYAISGRVDPLARDISLNLAFSVKNADLTSLTPYMEKYGGYPLNKGKLLLQLNYELARRHLAASNKIVIVDLTLGARNNSPEATRLPIKLGIALLKDRAGRIDLDVPLSGSLDDPNFKIGPLILKVVQNLLAKAATSPFTLLAKALGGGNEDLSSVDFAPGQAVLAPSEKSKVRKLAKALYDRPALTLQIAGACASAADGSVLARRHLQRRINKLRADELAASGRPVQSVESIQLAPADYERLLQKLYERAFGPIATNQAASSPSNAPPVAAIPPPENPSGPAYAPPDSPVPPSGGGEVEKGGQTLMRHEAAQRTPLLAVAPTPAAPVPAPAPATPSAAPSAPDVAQMEQRLLADIHVTDDELRELAQTRARAVQSALLESGQIPPERVFILAPKPINAAAPGAARANFSLE